MSLGDSGSNKQTTTTSTAMSPEQKALYAAAMPFVSSYTAGGGAPMAPTTSVTPTNATQQAGYTSALGGAGAQQGIADSSAGAQNFLTSGAALSPATNPALRDTIAYAIEPATKALTETMLPSIRGEAVTTGNFGSSRQGIAESSALSDAYRQMLGTGASISTAGYNSGLDAMTQALKTTGVTQGAQTAPAGTISAVGEAQQNQSQAELDAANQAATYNAQQPLVTAQQLLGLLGMTPGGTATATTKTPGADPLSQALGIGMAGGGILTSMLPFF